MNHAIGTPFPDIIQITSRPILAKKAAHSPHSPDYPFRTFLYPNDQHTGRRAILTWMVNSVGATFSAKQWGCLVPDRKTAFKDLQIGGFLFPRQEPATVFVSMTLNSCSVIIYGYFFLFCSSISQLAFATLNLFLS